MEIDVLPPKTIRELYEYVAKDTRIPYPASDKNGNRSSDKNTEVESDSEDDSEDEASSDESGY